MPIPFFSPFYPVTPARFFDAWGVNLYAPTAKPPAGEPIAVKTMSGDPGISIATSRDAMTLRGVAGGPKVVRDSSGYVKYEVAAGIGVDLDVEKAPTIDVFGRTNFTEKNSRCFGLDTRKGQTAAECAQKLADKVNANDDFRAKVTANADGSAMINFTRR